MKIHRKFDVATAQLDRAILLYFECDYYSAATLAGASEEILGKYLEVTGSISELESQIRAIQGAGEILFKKQYTEKHLASMINEARNWLKHFTEGNDLAFDEKEAAANLIDRACTNYYKLTGKETEGMRRFMKDRVTPNNAVLRSNPQSD